MAAAAKWKGEGREREGAHRVAEEKDIFQSNLKAISWIAWTMFPVSTAYVQPLCSAGCSRHLGELEINRNYACTINGTICYLVHYFLNWHSSLRLTVSVSTRHPVMLWRLLPCRSEWESMALQIFPLSPSSCWIRVSDWPGFLPIPLSPPAEDVMLDEGGIGNAFRSYLGIIYQWWNLET